MSVYRSVIRRNLNKCLKSHRSSRTTLHSSASSPCHGDLSAIREPASHPKASSTVHVGTSYEHLCARTLPRLDFQDLTRTGGRDDRGIDLLGKWQPISLRCTRSPPLNVAVQCKAVARKAGPEMIRELEGALAGATGDWSGEDTIGVLCARREVTAGVRDALKRSKRGLVWLMVEDLDEAGKEDKKGDEEEMREGAEYSKEDQEVKEGRIRQILWNDRVQRLLGEVTGTGVVHIPGEDGGPMETEVLMSCNGMLELPEYRRKRWENTSPDLSHLW